MADNEEELSYSEEEGDYSEEDEDRESSDEEEGYEEEEEEGEYEEEEDYEEDEGEVDDAPPPKSTTNVLNTGHTPLQRSKVVYKGKVYHRFDGLAKILGVAHSWRSGNNSENGDTATIVGKGIFPFDLHVAIKLDHNGKVVLIGRSGIVEISGKATKVCISRYRTHRVSATRSHSITTQLGLQAPSPPCQPPKFARP